MLSSDSSVHKKFVKATFSKNYINNIMLMSDGFSAAYKDYGIIKKENIFSKIRKGTTLEHILRKIRKFEEYDSGLIKVPRVKKSDDATCLFIELYK